jgi:hypothetical protein
VRGPRRYRLAQRTAAREPDQAAAG